MCLCRVPACPPKLEPPASISLPAGSQLQSHSSTAVPTPLQAHARHSNPIAAPFQDGFLQTAVSKATRRSTLAHPRETIAPGRSRYSTNVYRPQRCSPSRAAFSSRASRAIPQAVRCFDSMRTKGTTRGLRSYFFGGRCRSFSASAAFIMIGFPPLGGWSTIAQSSEHCGPTQP